MTFLPDGYKVPSKSNYMKLKDGPNNIRILSSAIVGFEYWNTDNKPVRLRENPSVIPVDIRLDEKTGKPTAIKHFWAFIVYNIDEGHIQVMEITQAGIQEDIKALADNPKWGDPKGYELTITRTGSGLETRYQTMPCPHSPLTDEIAKKYAAMTINLEALFDGGNPITEGAVMVQETQSEQVPF